MIQTQYFFKNIPENIHPTIRKKVSEKLTSLNKYFKDKKSDTKIKVESTNKGYLIHIDFYWPDYNVIIDDQHRDLWKLINNSFANLKQNTLKQLDESKDFNRVSVSYQTLQTYVTTQKPQSFSKQLEPLIPGLKKYIKREIKTITLLLKSEIYLEIDEVLDQVVSKSFDTFPGNNPDLDIKHWLHQIASLVIRLDIKKQRVESKRNVSWENLLDKEIDRLEERLTVDYEGNPEIAVRTQEGLKIEEEIEVDDDTWYSPTLIED